MRKASVLRSFGAKKNVSRPWKSAIPYLQWNELRVLRTGGASYACKELSGVASMDNADLDAESTAGTHNRMTLVDMLHAMSSLCQLMAPKCISSAAEPSGKARANYKSAHHSSSRFEDDCRAVCAALETSSIPRRILKPGYRISTSRLTNRNAAAPTPSVSCAQKSERQNTRGQTRKPLC